MGYTTVQKHPRYRVDVPVEVLTTDGTSLSGATANISMGGLFLCTPEMIRPGTHVLVALEAPELQLEARARVVHSVDPALARARGTQVGLGLSFDALTEEAHALLKTFLFTLFREGKRIAVLPPPLPRDFGPADVVESGAFRIGSAARADPFTPPPVTPPIVRPVRRGLRAGDVLSRHVVIDQLGEGGMAQVWLARQKTEEGFTQPVVLKTIAPRWFGNREFMELFQDEARLAAQLHHPNVVEIFDLINDDGSPLLVMEHLEGRTLAQMMEALAAKGMTLPHPLAARIAADCCAALAYAHTMIGQDGKPMELIHRDVTPDNIFITYDGRVKLLDFGIARAAQQAHETLPGCVRGKLNFLAPEQVRAENQDRRVDIWAMGINLFSMLTGALPFTGRSEMEIFMAIMKHNPPAPSSLVLSVPKVMDALVLRALEKEPRARFSQISEMQRQLEEFLKKQPVGATQLMGVMDTLFPETRDADRIRVAALLASPLPQPDLSNPNTPLPFVEVAFTDASAATAPTAPRTFPSGSSPTLFDGVNPLSQELHAAAAPQRSMVGIVVALGVLLVAGGVWFTQFRTAEPPRAAVVTPEIPARPVPALVLEEPTTTTPKPPPPPAEIFGHGGILVRSNVNSRVFVDGADQGPTPLTLPNVAEGPHHIRVVNQLGGAALEITVSVADGKIAERDVNFQRGRLIVKTTPQADILVDGAKAGRTPTGAMALYEGSHTVTLIHKKLGTRHMMVNVKPGKTETVKVKLK